MTLKPEERSLPFYRRLTSTFGPLFSWGNWRYSKRVSAELSAFRNCENVHDLPEIFHYWSNKYLVPLHAPFGFENPDEFFFLNLCKRCCNAVDRAARFVSIGSGNCDLEVSLAEKLRANGQQDFVIECLDLNPDMLARGLSAARLAGVEGLLQFNRGDFNQWQPEAGAYDAVIANQSLHHVLGLEHLFESIRLGLKPCGSFIISDMIGRNGHQRWP
ncbi:MAG: class I SAM-dependent methyltransferase, partial [Lysobacterales bacterium]